MTAPLLEAAGVGRTFSRGGTAVAAVRSMDLVFATDTPRVIALAGESGCGKSTFALMALGFVLPTSGEIRYCGVNVAHLRGLAFRAFRRDVQAVFQNPFETFNPVYSVDHVFHRALRQMQFPRRGDTRKAAVRDVLREVDLDPDNVLGRYPHQLSGGQLQRIAIARAMLLRPRLLVADEPASMIDASLRILVLRNILALKSRFGASILYIAHDLSTALQISDELLIARNGEIVERGDPADVIAHPRHPYARQLVDSIPSPDPDDRWTTDIRACGASLTVAT